MKICEILPRRINRSRQTFEYLRHEITATVYNLYIHLRKESSSFQIIPTKLLPKDSIHEYIDYLEVTLKYLYDNKIDVPQCLKLLKDLLEYLDYTE